jgi:sterol desaturase/sphingolipid hydroxylase (fatty acid hydroxylase superfamily)
MTTVQENSQPKDKSLLFNRALYSAFIAFSIYFLLINKDLASAMSNLGIALIFDPFNPKITWNNRPRYQRVWLFLHVSIVLIMVAYLLLSSLNIIE